MNAPILQLTAEESAELRALRQGVTGNDALLDSALAELILFRRLRKTIRSTRYLMNADPVRSILDRMPGARRAGGQHREEQ